MLDEKGQPVYTPEGKAVRVPRTDAEGEPLNGPIISLAWAVKFMIGELPQGSLTTAEGERAHAIMAACRKADQERERTGGASLIELDEEDYEYLMKTLFDDAEGRRLGVNMNNGAGIGGSLALNTFAPWMVIAVRHALKVEQIAEPAKPLTLLQGDNAAE